MFSFNQMHVFEFKITSCVLQMRDVVIFDRSDPQLILAIEKCLMRGKSLLLENFEEYVDNLITPIIQHRNTTLQNEADEGRVTAKYFRFKENDNDDTQCDDTLSRESLKIPL